MESVNFLRRNGNFFGLIVTTTVSLLLVTSNQRQWSISGGAYVTLNKHRPSVQIAVQVISAWFGFLQQNVVCQLFNYATRLRLRKMTPTLDSLYAWNCISAARTAWALRIKFLLPTLVFALAMLVPSALWAGAITPTLIVTQSPRPGSLHIPQFQNSSMIREWPSEIGSSGPLLWTAKGLLSFSPGVRMLGSLIASAASATTVDGGVRQHPKFDNTRYTYNGRSYGVGASAGLADSPITDDPLALSYMFQKMAFVQTSSVSIIQAQNLSLQMKRKHTPIPLSAFSLTAVVMRSIQTISVMGRTLLWQLVSLPTRTP